MLKKIFSVFFAILLTGSSVLCASAFTASGFEISAGNAVLVTYDTDEVIFDKQGSEPVNISALNIVMSSLVIAEHCEDLDAYSAEMTREVKKALLGTGLAVMNLKIGEKYSVRELLSLGLIGTYSDAMYLAATHIFGSVNACVDAMNERAAQLGLEDTVFTDINGFEASQYSTARELAVIFKAACENSVIKEIMSTRKYTLSASGGRATATETLSEISFSNSCMLLNPATVHYYNKIVAGKTGTTDVAGRCIVTLSEEKGVRYICVLLGEPVTKEKDENGNTVRYDFRDTKNLVNWALTGFSYKEVVSVGDIISEVPCLLSDDTDRISVAAGTGLYATLPIKSDSSTLEFKCSFDKEEYKAPISSGDPMGTAEVLYGGEVIGTISLVAATDAEKSTIQSIKQLFLSIVTSKAFKSIVLVIAAIIVAFVITIIVINTSRHIRRSKKVHKDNYK